MNTVAAPKKIAVIGDGSADLRAAHTAAEFGAIGTAGVTLLQLDAHLM